MQSFAKYSKRLNANENGYHCQSVNANENHNQSANENHSHLEGSGQAAIGGRGYIYIKVTHFTNFSNFYQLRVNIKKAI